MLLYVRALNFTLARKYTIYSSNNFWNLFFFFAYRASLYIVVLDTQWILRFARIYTNHSPRIENGEKSVRSISRPTSCIYQILPPSSDLSLNHAPRCSSRSFSISPSILSQNSTTMKSETNAMNILLCLESVKTRLSHKIADPRIPETDLSSSIRDEKERNRHGCFAIFIGGDIHRVILRWLAANRRVHWPRYNTLVLLWSGRHHPSSIGRGIDILIHFPRGRPRVDDCSNFRPRRSQCLTPLVGSRAPIKITFVPFHAINVRLNDPIFTLAAAVEAVSALRGFKSEKSIAGKGHRPREMSSCLLIVGQSFENDNYRSLP